MDGQSADKALSWEVVDVRARVKGGCYYISLAHDPAGHCYIARFCADPRADMNSLAYAYAAIDYSYTRERGIGHDTDLEKVKAMCEQDALARHLVNST